MMDRETAAFICSHIFNDTRPVLLVARDHGDWMYLCGESHGPDEEYQVVGREHLVERDGTLHETLDLPDEMEAEREIVGGPWARRKLSPE